MKHTISVTQEDIDKGIHASPTICPVALALKRCNINNLYVGAYTIFIYYANPIYVGEHTIYVDYANPIDTPQNVQNFITSFDGGKSVQPFTFELEF